MYSLQGKNAFITGGTAGIGLAVAHAYIEAGAHVVIAGRREQGEAIATDIGAGFYRLDVADEAAVIKGFDWLEAEFGKLDILVNNAGFAADELMGEISSTSIEKTININFKGVLYGLLHGPRHMRDGSVIINTSSTAAVIASPTQLVYSACKAAVCSMTQTAAIELGPRGFRVNAVLPGGVETDMAMPEAIFKTLTTCSRVGQTADLVGLYNLLASDASAYITGQNICVDGGLSAGISMQLMELMLDQN